MKLVLSSFFIFSLIGLTPAQSMDILPDLTQKTDDDVKKIIKTGFIKVVIGVTTTQLVAPTIPNLGKSHGSEGTFLSPKVVKGMGSLLCIEGAKDFCGGSVEWYKRYSNTLDSFKSGLLDCGTATILYYSSSCIPNVLTEPYISLGGQAILAVTVSYLGYRGLKNTTNGVIQWFVSTDLTTLAYNFLPKITTFWKN